MRAAGVLVSVVTLAALILWAMGQPRPRLPSDVGGIALVIGGIAVYGLATAVRGERWLRLLRALGGCASRTDSYSLTAVGYMGNAVMPARAGDLLRASLITSRSNLSLKAVVGSVVAERLADTAVLGALFGLLAFGLLRGIDTPDGGSLPIAAAVLAVLVCAAAAVWLARDHPRVARILGFLAPFAESTRGLKGRHGLAIAAFTAVIWSLEAAVVMAVGAATSIEMTPIDALYVIAVCGIALLVPAGPGQLGALDAGFAFGVSAIGASGAEALAFVLVARFVLLVPITIVGSALLLGRYRDWRTLAAG